MKLKVFLSSTCLLFLIAVQSVNAAYVPITLNNNDVSNLSVTYHEDGQYYDLSTTGASTQYINVNAITQDLSSDYYTLSFEYQSSATSNHFQIWYGNEWNSSRAHVYDPLAATSNWNLYSINIKTDRKKFSWGNNGDMLRFCFFYTDAGASFKMRNIRISDLNKGYKEIKIASNSSTTVQAEDYNIGGLNSGYYNRQYLLNLPKYVNPAGQHMPIVGWGLRGSADRYSEMAECGFNLCIANHGTDADLNEQLQNCKGTGIRLLVDYWKINDSGSSSELRQTTVNNYNSNDELAGWTLPDEPHATQYGKLGQEQKDIRAVINPNKLTYLNLLHSGTDFSAVGADNFADYLQRSVREVGTGFLSFDCYPIIRLSDGSDYVRPFFYESLEIAAMVAKQYGIPFWTFTRSRGDVVGDVTFPVPTKAHMRFQVFNSLAYGSQGIQYYTYCNWDFYNPQYQSPLELNTETWDWVRTPTWDLVKDLNTEIHNLEWVFLGCNVTDVSHTGTSLPKATKQLTSLPAPFKAITSEKSGVLVSQFENGNNRFLMIISHDIINNQTVIINKNVTSLNRVNADGTTTASPAINDTINLAPGDYILYQWAAENDAPQTQTAILAPNNIAGLTNTYRDDTTGVVLTQAENWENGFALDNMGDYNWKQYTLGQYKISAKRSISKIQAIKNWGSWFKYDVVADQDMDVNIYIGHAVKWQDYGLTVSTGVAPGTSYTIDGSAALNWPKQYAASMMLALDRISLKPNQTSRPVAPDTYEEDGATFNSILANKSNWTSTQIDGVNNDTLWFWPEAGGDNSPATHYNAQPDYQNVHLSQGLHTFTITSMCSPWIFDCIKFEDVHATGINNTLKQGTTTLAYGSKGAITIVANHSADIYSVSGISMTKASGTVKLPAGFYIVKMDDQVQRVLVR